MEEKEKEIIVEKMVNEVYPKLIDKICEQLVSFMKECMKVVMIFAICTFVLSLGLSAFTNAYFVHSYFYSPDITSQSEVTISNETTSTNTNTNMNTNDD